MTKGNALDKLQVSSQVIRLKRGVECYFCELRHKKAGSVPDCATCVATAYAKNKVYDQSFFKVEFDGVAAGGWADTDRMIDKWVRAGSPHVYIEKDVGAMKVNAQSLFYLAIILGVLYWQVTYWYNFAFDPVETLEDNAGNTITVDTPIGYGDNYQSDNDYKSAGDYFLDSP
jgi:hypothetical protein